nr:MAG TPA: hypothetical protein [Caudoviricetes sp.]
MSYHFLLQFKIKKEQLKNCPFSINLSYITTLITK